MENPKAMSPEVIIAGWDVYDFNSVEHGQTVFNLTQDMLSLLAYVREAMPTKVDPAKPGYDGYRSEGYNMAIDDCRAVIIVEANKLT